MTKLRVPLAAAVMTALVFATTGCQTTGRHVRWYDGPPRPGNEVALLQIQHTGGVAILHEIDGAPLNRGNKHAAYNTVTVELKPDTHVLSVGYSASGVHSTDDLLLVFTCRSDRVYKLRVAPVYEKFGTTLEQAFLGGESYWMAWVIDSRTGAVVGGMPRAELLRWYEK